MDIHGRDNSFQPKTNVCTQCNSSKQMSARNICQAQEIKKYIIILHSSLVVCAASPKVVQSVTSDGMTWFNQNNHCH